MHRFLRKFVDDTFDVLAVPDLTKSIKSVKKMQKIYVNCKEDNCKETEIYTYSSKEIPKEKFEKYKCLKFETVPSKIISRATQSSKNP